MSNETRYLVALSTFVPFGPARINLLKKYFGSYKSVWTSGTSELLKIGLSESLVSGFDKHRSELGVNKYIRLLADKKVKVITIEDDNYPENLNDLPNAPLVLYYIGSIIPKDKSAVAIVGTRKMTNYGREVTALMSSRLADYGITIVSGLALGIDAQAHKGALSVGGRSIAVLASGLDIVTPVSNRHVAVEIIKRKLGAIVSEYPLGYPPLRENFPNRNRIISGLSKAIVVPEARIASGTIHTVNHASEQGREVFAIPGSILSPGSELPLYLLKNGAKMATKPEDVVEELNFQFQVDKESKEKMLPSDEVEGEIVRLLEIEPFHLDEMARALKIKTSELSAKLSMMELKGMIKLSEDKYKLI